MMTSSLKTINATRAIVFLDIDGVLALNPAAGGWEVFKAFESNEFYPSLWESIFDGFSVENLKRLHDDFTPLYVISSSWRRELTVEQFRILFEQTRMCFVSSNLHPVWCTSTEGIPNRPLEINDWLSQHLGGAPFLVIDDSNSGKDLNDNDLFAAGHVHLCVPEHGFNDESLKISRELLRIQLLEKGEDIV